MSEKKKYPPVTKPDDILDPVARFHAQQLQRIIELLEQILEESQWTRLHMLHR